MYCMYSYVRLTIVNLLIMTTWLYNIAYIADNQISTELKLILGISALVIWALQCHIMATHAHNNNNHHTGTLDKKQA